ncbi:MAG: hypothetical protein K6F44_03845 [Lachnospiraceae bacterium]|nr:hypothetical protein [Lachnospiraceae bacterium]
MMNNKITFSKIYKNSLQFIVALPAVFVAFVLLIGAVKAQAAESVSVRSINYDESTITVQLGQNDNLLLISDSKKKKWEAIPIDKALDNTVTMDISWVSLTKDYILSLKGDISTEPVSVTIPKQSAALRAAYNTATGRISFTGETGEIEWRKKESIEWSDLPSDDVFKTRLDSMCTYGATVVFRIKGSNGTSISNPGRRPGKEVYVSVPKKIAAPNIKIDDSTLTVAVNSDMQYRMADSKGNPVSTEWTNINKEENMPLAQLASASIVNSQGSNTTEVSFIQFRTKATASKQVSNVKTIEVPAQFDLDASQKENITISYTSSTSFEINVPFAGTQTPYEYCIINTSDQADGITINDLEELTWKVINSTTPVPISRDKNNADEGSLVYVRKKAVGTLGETGYELASPAYLVGTVNYPGEVSTGSGSITWLTTVAGMCSGNNPDGYLSFDLYSPTNSFVSEIRFVDYVSIGTTRETLTRASGDFRCSVITNNDPGATDDTRYIITTTINSTAKLDRFANEASTRKMLAYITLDNSTEAFKSTSDKGVGLYIIPSSKIGNPSGSTKRGDMIEIAQKLGWENYDPDTYEFEYATDFERIAGSTRDKSIFMIKLDLGTRKIPSAVPGEFTNDNVAVSKIIADAKTFTAENGFTVEYADTVNAYSEETAMAVIKVDTAVMEQSIDDRNTPVTLTIILNNGEIIENAATVTFKETANIVGGPYSWTITEGNLIEQNESTTINEGVTTITYTDRVDKTIELKVFRNDYSVSLLSVKWGDHYVCDSINMVGSDITLDLSNRLINKIDVAETTTKPLTFTFDNGFVLSSGFTLTITYDPDREPQP